MSSSRSFTQKPIGRSMRTAYMCVTHPSATAVIVGSERSPSRTFHTNLSAFGDNIGIVVELPGDFPAALDAAPGTRGFFDGLSNSLKRYHVDTVNAATTAETRARRIERSVGLFAAGKKR